MMRGIDVSRGPSTFLDRNMRGSNDLLWDRNLDDPILTGFATETKKRK